MAEGKTDDPGGGSAVRDQLMEQLNRQRTAFRESRSGTDYAERMVALKAMQEALYKYRHEYVEAVSADFGGRAPEETLLLEIFVLIDEIRHTRRHLKKWMKIKWVMPNWQFLPSRTKIIHQPLGVVGVMGAWNYQLLLTFGPMIGALSAGNHVMMKPSELAPRTAELMQKMISETFPPEYVTVITGDVDVASAFSTLPFDHLIFTGSTRVGKIIMRNASEHLTPVTLELGGKSPALVAREFPIGSGARRIVHGKFSNSGQTCVAPDYAMVHVDQLDTFVAEARKVIEEFYPQLVGSDDYTRIATKRHYDRLVSLVNEAREKGAEVLAVNPAGEDCNAENRVFPPTLVWNCPEDCTLMQEELFGPILPIVTYETTEGAIDYINDRPRPLALYYFDRDHERTWQVLTETISGGVTVNGCIYHLPQNNLPFGGVGDSGMGAYHGFDGFNTFSKKKAIFHQSRFASTTLLRPPYGFLARFIIGTLIRNWPTLDLVRRYRKGK